MKGAGSHTNNTWKYSVLHIFPLILAKNQLTVPHMLQAYLHLPFISVFCVYLSFRVCTYNIFICYTASGIEESYDVVATI